MNYYQLYKLFLRIKLFIPSHFIHQQIFINPVANKMINSTSKYQSIFSSAKRASQNPQDILSLISHRIQMAPNRQIQYLTKNQKVLQNKNRINQSKLVLEELQTVNYDNEILYKNGDYYFGQTFQKQPQGEGLYIFNSESMSEQMGYIGTFVKGQFQGFGKLFSYSSPRKGFFIYQGQWKNGSRNGEGKEFYNQDENSFYYGNWQNDERNGEGMLKFPNGFYQGMWVNGQMHGYGSLTLNKADSKTVIKGLWERDQNLEGDITYYNIRNGKQQEQGKYVGQIRDNKREGYGRYDERDLSYSGVFVNDFPTGQGIYFDKVSKTKIEGNLSEKYPSQIVKIQYNNHDKYEGTVSIVGNKILRRQGLYTYANGDEVEGKFMDNDRGQIEGQVRVRRKKRSKLIG